MDNETQVKIVAKKISFLMHHQEILPDLKELAQSLLPRTEGIDKNSAEYLQGAHDALVCLVTFLSEKGPKI